MEETALTHLIRKCQEVGVWKHHFLSYVSKRWDEVALASTQEKTKEENDGTRTKRQTG